LLPFVLAAITALQIEGVDGKEEAIAELLPRPLPTELTEAELTELTRRINNLELFDSVDVERHDTILSIRVRRKFVWTPIFELSTGQTFADTTGTIGAVHNDVDGHASRLAFEVGYEERRPRFSVAFEEHPYRSRRWQNEYEAYYTGSSLRFAGDEDDSWIRNRLGGRVEFLSPTRYGTPFRVELQFNAYRELVTDVQTPASPRDGTYAGVANEFVYDRYTWNDLVPRGLYASLELRPGAFIGPAEARHEARLYGKGGLRLGEKTVLVASGIADAVNGGNVNHSVLVGSQRGVRGLEDSFYRTRAAAWANVELRHAVEIASRWYIQGVLFTDAAVFEPMDAEGHATRWEGAWSTGAGLRLLPTALVDTLLRIDGSRLHAPFGAWFVQLGITQYI
jgi:hypothetical protein